MVDITFTYDLEDNRPSHNLPQRFDGITQEVLACLAQMDVRGTFFVVGTAARTAPAIVREIHAQGHEVALHSYDHQMLPDQTPETFCRETALGKKILEDITGNAVQGYRAPNFSLTKDSVWAHAELHGLGFEYSSSVLPIAHPYYGYSGVPRQPFRWPSGLLELPAPVTRIGPYQLPFLGGTYFRALPRWLVKQRLLEADRPGCWFYAHPHDFDYLEPLYKIRDVSWLVTFALRMRRKGNLARMAQFLTDRSIAMTDPFGELVTAGHFGDAQTFQPSLD